MKNITFIGSGNVATHLAKTLFGSVDICSVYSRNIENANRLAVKLNAIGVDDLARLDSDVDLNIVTVSDTAIQSVLKGLNKSIRTVHTSGSIDIQVFSGFSHYGILYPLQTFSKLAELDMANVPFLIEANSKLFEEEIKTFCNNYLSNNYQMANSNLRSEIHLAAVISNNFITSLLVESENILKDNGLSLDLIKPLIDETIHKSFSDGPKASQTGPAKRGDTKVIKKQINKIVNPELKEVYKRLTDLIIAQNS